MQLTIERAALLKCLQHVQSVVERRNTIPILSNVMLSAQQAELTLTATDMDIAVADVAIADVQTPGATTAPAHMLYDIVRKLPEGGQINLLTEDEQLKVTAGRSTFTLPCLPTEDFPALGDGDMPHRFDLSGPDLQRLIDKTRFAISTEETRYYLNGIYLHAAEANGAGTLRAVATDGHRLAQVEQDLPSGAEGMPGVIVPRKAVAEVRKLLDDGDEAIHVALSDTKIRFAVGGAVLTSKLIDGNFPDYTRVIPQGNDKVMDVSHDAFQAAVDRVSTISSDKTRAVKLSIEGDKLVLSASSPEQASATEELPIAYDSDALDIGFNSRYVLDMTAQIEGEQVRFQMADAASPTVVSDSDDARALYVLMPMRV